jgi:hypothetical protein
MNRYNALKRLSASESFTGSSVQLSFQLSLRASDRVLFACVDCSPVVTPFVVPEVFVLVAPPVVPFVVVVVVPPDVPFIAEVEVPFAVAVDELLVRVLVALLVVDPPPAVVEEFVVWLAVMSPVVPVTVDDVPVVVDPETELVTAPATLLLVVFARAVATLPVAELTSCEVTTVAVPSGVIKVGLTELAV